MLGKTPFPVVSVLLASLFGCPSSSVERPACAVDGDCPAGSSCLDGSCTEPTDGGPETCGPRLVDRYDWPPTVDVLFAIDNSGSMTEEQQSLFAQIPRFFEVLVSGSLGTETFSPVQSLRVGVITSDMGTGPAGVCGSMFGDDGVLLTSGRTASASCMAAYPTWLEFAAGDDPSTLATDVECVASDVGTGGCGFEQQLDAILKALTPSTSGITFQAGTVGHGDGQNAGFVRTDSVLVIVALTDEDDCSAIDPGLFEADNPDYDPNLNLRCFNHPEAVHPVARYVDGLLELRADAPGRLLYAPIAGIPVDLTPDPDAPLGPQVDAILDDSRMIEQPNPDGMTALIPSCDIPGRGRSYPPRRMVALAGELADAGAIGVVGSICQEDYTGVMDAILTATLGAATGGLCVESAPPRELDGRIPCELVELSPGDDCAGLPGRTEDGTDRDTGQQRCIVEQLPISGATPTGPGWYFDDFSSGASRTCEGTDGQLVVTGAAGVSGWPRRFECDTDC